MSTQGSKCRVVWVDRMSRPFGRSRGKRCSIGFTLNWALFAWSRSMLCLWQYWGEKRCNFFQNASIHHWLGNILKFSFPSKSKADLHQVVSAMLNTAGYFNILKESTAPSTTIRDDSAFIRWRSCSIPSTVHVDDDCPTIIIVGDLISRIKSSGSPRFPSTQKRGNPKQSNAVTGSK